MRKTKKVIELVGELMSKGVTVKYRWRKDGGVLITQVGQQKFKGAKGNTYAREILGIKMTRKQKGQRKKAFRRSPVQFKKMIREQIKLTNKAYRESTSPFFKGAKTSIMGVKKDIQNIGLEKTLQKLRNNMNYALGYAYPLNVLTFVERLKALSPKFQPIIDFLIKNQHHIKDDILMKGYDIAYDYTTELITLTEAVTLLSNNFGI